MITNEIRLINSNHQTFTELRRLYYRIFQSLQRYQSYKSCLIFQMDRTKLIELTYLQSILLNGDRKPEELPVAKNQESLLVYHVIMAL